MGVVLRRKGLLVSRHGGAAFDFAAETHRGFGYALENGLVEADKGAAEHEEDVGRVNGVLIYLAGGRGGLGGRGGAAGAAVVGGDGGCGAGGAVLFDVDGDFGAFDELEESLLDAFAADVATCSGLSAGELVEFIKDDDAVLGGVDVVVGLDEESLNAGFDVLANVAGLCK